MATVKISQQALSDMKKIEKTYGPKSERYKHFSSDTITHCKDYLEANPRMGKKILMRDIDYFRQLIYRGVWRIIYTYDEELDRVEILNVLSTSRRF